MTQHPQLLRVQLDGGEVEVVDSGEGGGGDEVAEAEHELGAAADLHPAPRERRTRTWAEQMWDTNYTKTTRSWPQTCCFKMFAGQHNTF